MPRGRVGGALVANRQEQLDAASCDAQSHKSLSNAQLGGSLGLDGCLYGYGVLLDAAASGHCQGNLVRHGWGRMR